MPIDEQTAADLAARLYEAHESAEPIDPLTDDHDLSVADAYAIQSRLVDRRLADGSEVIGHKIGLTSAGIQEQLGVDEPDFGRLLDAMFVDDHTVRADDLVAPRIEPEIGFVLDDDLDDSVSHLDVLAATRAVVPVVEVIDSRVRDWNIDLEDTIADNASSALVLAGETLTDPAACDLSLEGVKLSKNGELAVAGVGANVLEHPARAVAWLANTMAEMGETLAAGDLVLSGSCTPAVDVEPGDVFTVEFSTLGGVSGRVV